MTTICAAMGVSRARQYERRQQGAGARRRRYRKADDARYLALIRQVIAERATCGYRRVTVFLNRRLRALGAPGVNPKRVYRLMAIGGLLLERSTGRPRRMHDGTIRVTRSNRRWCSDAFEIVCWSRERLRVVFSLDCCDREVLSFVGTPGGIDGELIRDLMLEAVTSRFGDIDRLPQPIEWLSDNGPAYIARDTVAFARSLGFVVCMTPYYSPESNGMAEAFVKTFRRDYVDAHPLYNARYVLEQLPKWFEDYNEHHPHKALKMKSPREYRRYAAKLDECPAK